MRGVRLPHPAAPSPPRDPAPAQAGRVRRAAAHHRHGAWARRDAAAGPPAQGEAAPDDPAQARRHRHPDAPWRPSSRAAPRALALPLLDPLRPFRPRRPRANGIPRISLPGVTAPFPVALRRPPAPDDPLDATRLALRLQALGAALDDLPRQARRFARWKAAPPPRRRRRAKQKTACRPHPPRLAAASGPSARPAPRQPAHRTRCTRSCTISTASPSTCWSIPTRRDAALILPSSGGGGREADGGGVGPSNAPRTLSRAPAVLPTRPCVWPYTRQPFPAKQHP